MSENNHTPEPFGYFKPEPFGWTDCSETDDGAIPLFDKVAIRTIQKQRDEMAETINAIAALCTYRHESKEDFIARVRAALGDDPELRISELRRQRDELLAAAKRAETWLDQWASAEPYVSDIRAAIARAKGGAA